MESVHNHVQNHSSTSSKKSYLIINGSNPHGKFTTNEIRTNWSRFKHCLKSLIYHPLNNMIIVGPNSHEKFITRKIRSSWSPIEHCSKSLVWPLGSRVCIVFIGCNSHAKFEYCSTVRILLKITRLTSRMPYLDISGPIHMNSKPKVKLGHLTYRKSYLVIIDLSSQEKLIKRSGLLKLGVR